MGSVIDECECPSCHYPHAVSDYYYKIAIEYIFCKRCGYSTDWVNVFNPEPDAEMYEEVHGGVGCLQVHLKGCGTLHGLDKPEDAIELKETFKPEEWTTSSGEICDAASVTYLKDGKWMQYDLFTKTEVEFDSMECENK